MVSPYENGCTWNKYICFSAIMGGHMDILKYLHENGCNFNSNDHQLANKFGQSNMIQYFDSKWHY